MEPKWYQSKKFLTTLVSAVVMVANDGLDMNLPKETIMYFAGLVIAYITGQSLVDIFKIRQAAPATDHPLLDPMVREAVESLTSQFYDYSAAHQSGVAAHAKDLVIKVIDSLAVLLDDKTLAAIAADNQVKTEILRLVLKKYNEDTSMMEGKRLAELRTAG